MQGSPIAAEKRPNPSSLDGLRTPLLTRFSITRRGAQPWIRPTLFRRAGRLPTICDLCDCDVAPLSGRPHHTFNLSLFRNFGLGFSEEDA